MHKDNFIDLKKYITKEDPRGVDSSLDDVTEEKDDVTEENKKLFQEFLRKACDKSKWQRVCKVSQCLEMSTHDVLRLFSPHTNLACNLKHIRLSMVRRVNALCNLRKKLPFSIRYRRVMMLTSDGEDRSVDVPRQVFNRIREHILEEHDSSPFDTKRTTEAGALVVTPIPFDSHD